MAHDSHTGRSYTPFRASGRLTGAEQQTHIYCRPDRENMPLRYGGADVTRRIRGPACQMILAVLDHALHADNT